METKKEFKQKFINERTRIISEMLDNPDKYGIYPTTKCFNALDELWDQLSESYAAQKCREEKRVPKYCDQCGEPLGRKHKYWCPLVTDK